MTDLEREYIKHHISEIVKYLDQDLHYITWDQTLDHLEELHHKAATLLRFREGALGYDKEINSFPRSKE